jgi:acyl carrier protein
VFLEVGPRTTLSSLAVQHFAKLPKAAGERCAIAMLADTADPAAEIGGLGQALAKLWCAGLELPWDRIWSGGRKVPLVSSYPFQRKDYRFSEGRSTEQPMVAASAPLPGPLESSTRAAERAVPEVLASPTQRLAAELAVLFGDYSGLGIERLEATFVECGFDSLVLMQIGVELGKRYGVSVALRDLMEKHNTLQKLATHLAEAAPAEKIQHLAVPVALPDRAPDRAPHIHAALASSPAAGAPLKAALAPAQSSGQLDRARIEQLLVVREFIDRQLSELGAQDVLPAAHAAATNIQRGQGQARAAKPEAGEPLIRARHAAPPRPGAFRAPATLGEDAWYVFDAEQRLYDQVKH